MQSFELNQRLKVVNTISCANNKRLPRRLPKFVEISSFAPFPIVLELFETVSSRFVLGERDDNLRNTFTEIFSHYFFGVSVSVLDNIVEQCRTECLLVGLVLCSDKCYRVGVDNIR